MRNFLKREFPFSTDGIVISVDELSLQGNSRVVVIKSSRVIW